MSFLYRLILFIGLLSLEISALQAQNNLVITGANSATPGSDNSIIGTSSQPPSNNTGKANVFVGAGAGVLTRGSNNTYIGYIAGLRTYDGNDNTYMGFWAGYSLNGEQNVAIGRYAGYGGGIFSELARSRGSYNVYLGASAGYKGYPNGTDHNVMVGDSTGYNNATSGNVFVGSKAGFTNQSGMQGTFLGYQAGYNAVADSNTFVGYRSGYTTTTGKGNTFIGTASGRSNSSGSRNTFVGNGAGPASSDADDNVYIGYNTGQRDKGSQNTLLGTGADVLAQHLTNATAIGAGAQVSVSNAVVLGHQANVGIGTSAPSARLEVNSGEAHQSGLRFSQLRASSPAGLARSDKVLTVDATGQVVLTQAGRLSVRSIDAWADKVFAVGYPLASLDEVGQYVAKHQHLPGVPSATEVVEQGVDVVKMNALLLEKVEELTLYLLQQKKQLGQQQRRIDQLEKTVRQAAKPGQRYNFQAR